MREDTGGKQLLNRISSPAMIFMKASNDLCKVLVGLRRAGIPIGVPQHQFDDVLSGAGCSATMVTVEAPPSNGLDATGRTPRMRRGLRRANVAGSMDEK
jgi:hypothetical protein